MTPRSDIVRELISRLIAAAGREGSLTESVALEVERSFRQEFAGEEYYIKRMPTEARQEKLEVVRTAYLRGDPVEEIADANGISRRAIYRILKSRR